MLVGAIEHQADSHKASDTALEEALHTLMLVCFFGGRAELWEPFYRALGSLTPNVPAVVSLASKTTADPVRIAAGALARLDGAIEGLTNEGNPTRIVRIAIAGVFVDRLSGCRQVLWRVIRDGRQGDAVTSAINALILLGFDDFWTGQWDQAQRLLDEAIELCETHGYLLYASPGRQVQALIAAARGDYDLAQSLTDQMLQWALPRQIRSVQWQAWQARALGALGRGDFEAAYQQTVKISQAGVLASTALNVLWSTMDFVEAAVDSTDRHAEAAAHVNAVREAQIAALSSRLALAAGGSAAIAAPDESTLGLFETALAVPGIDRWQDDLARGHSPTANGCDAPRSPPKPDSISAPRWKPSNASMPGRGPPEPPTNFEHPDKANPAPINDSATRSRRKNARSRCWPPPG